MCIREGMRFVMTHLKELEGRGWTITLTWRRVAVPFFLGTPVGYRRSNSSWVVWEEGAFFHKDIRMCMLFSETLHKERK